MIDLRNADCFEFLPTLPPGSVDLAILDPPYCKVKKADWDHQWRTKAQYLRWLDRLLIEISRVLTPAGAGYCFASPQMTDAVRDVIKSQFNIISEIRWDKGKKTPGQRSEKARLRKYFPNYESVFYFERKGADAAYEKAIDDLYGGLMTPVHEYLKNEFVATAMSKSEFNRLCGYKAIPGANATRHYLSGSQFRRIPREQYENLSKETGRFQKPFAVIGRCMELLQTRFERIRGGIPRRYFELKDGDEYGSTWTFEPVQVYPGKHECEKPLAMMRHIVKSSCQPGGIILDPFAGSGNSLKAAALEGRQAVGCERDPGYYKNAARRIAEATAKEFAA